MRVSTLWQPWAQLVAIGAKPYETRSYPPPAKLLGQRIAIHAAVRDPVKMYMSMYRANDPAWEPICDALDDAGFDGADWSSLPLGAVVATAVLAEAYQVESLAAGWAKVGQQRGGDLPIGMFRTDRFGDYSPGRWAWLLTDVRQLAVPDEVKGKQGWWTWLPRCPHPVSDDPSAAACVSGGDCGCIYHDHLGAPGHG